MNFANPTADVLVPDGGSLAAALAATTHLAVGAHQDDLEIMAFEGILHCFNQPGKGFCGVTCTNGSGSARAGVYGNYDDTEMQAVRRTEQRAAARVGGYTAMIQLDYTSAAIKDPAGNDIVEDLRQILSAAQPEVLYLHNPADKHATHIATAVAALQAVRRLPREQRPKKAIGCEVWRDLDWLPDEEKVAMDVGGRDNFAAALLGIFDSQIAGGKRYDLATVGRRRANATYFASHGTDETDALAFGMDLTPLVEDDARDIVDYVLASVDRFRDDVRERLGFRLGG